LCYTYKFIINNNFVLENIEIYAKINKK